MLDLTEGVIGVIDQAPASVSHSGLRPSAVSGLPATIGKYRILRKLGAGATSDVFLGRDDFAGVDVAIKRVTADLLGNSHEHRLHRQSFAAEAALIGRLNHPNVVRLFDAVLDCPAPFIVMEFVAGPTLRRFCRADALLPVAQIVEIGFKCAMALDFMFRQGLIHRDVKPANLLTVLDGERVVDVKVSDFGSVYNLLADCTQLHRVGSLAYMSPEQIEGDDVDCRADIYSLAASLYHLIAGRPPFDATQQVAVMHQIFTAAPPPLKRFRDDVSSALEDLLLRAMAKDRNDRPANWGEFASALSELSARQPSPASRQEVLDSERFNLLRTLDFFADFGDVELWDVVRRGHWARYASGHALYRKNEVGNTFHINATGRVDIYRGGKRVAQLGAGNSVGEMAYLAPNPALSMHSVDILVAEQATCVSFNPETLQGLSNSSRHQFDKAFIRVLVRRLHAAHEALEHPRRIQSRPALAQEDLLLRGALESKASSRACALA